MKNMNWLLILTLILLVILPRLAVDLYLPSLPGIGKELYASEQSLQMTLTIFMFGSAISVLVAGPLSDIWGRKKTMFCGLAIFTFASFACVISHSITLLIIAKFFQAVGAGCGTVIARLVVKDTYAKHVQISVLAYLSAAMGICPLFAPVLGGFFQIYFGWRISFYLLILFALCVCLLGSKQLTGYSEIRNEWSFKTLLQSYKLLLRSRLFIGYSLAIGFAWSIYFAFMLASPFILQKILNMDPVKFGILFSFVVTGYVVGTFSTKFFANKIGWDRMILIASLFCLMGAILMIIFVSLSPLSWEKIIFPMMVIMIGVGIIIPCTQGAVMQPFPKMTGTASGLFFFIQMVFGGVCGLIIQKLGLETSMPMVSVIFVSSILLVISFYGLIYRTKISERVLSFGSV